MPDWGTVFLPTVPILELAVRGAVSFLALLLLLRVVGQREAGGLGVVDLLVVVLVAHAAGPGMTEGVETIADSFLLVLTILVLAVLVDALATDSRWSPGSPRPAPASWYATAPRTSRPCAGSS